MQKKKKESAYKFYPPNLERWDGLYRKQIDIGIVCRCQSPKYENGFKHLWHLASGRAMNTNDENI